MKKVITSLLISAALATVAVAGESETFGGLGISVWTGKAGVKIVGVIPNSPAESIGLQAGDLIVSANGTELSAIEPENQVSHLRGEAGTSISLVVSRDGDVFSVSTKRAGLSVQSLDTKEISDWYGKNQGLTAEELNFLASQKTTDGYQLLAVMQYGIPVLNSAENLGASAVQQISIKKPTEPVYKELFVQNSVQNISLDNKTQNTLLVNAKGARVNKQGKIPVYKLK
ncbi:MAG: PDZ domain-containing protein [Fibromonadaceae bacterium]|jgi:membrane-associated protease RseP (regulator of RpoE activity)|nr:PDZ domain-containing protein [Fibromonadaceae bacterium]